MYLPDGIGCYRSKRVLANVTLKVMLQLRRLQHEVAIMDVTPSSFRPCRHGSLKKKIVRL
jgi:hypothetical protein